MTRLTLLALALVSAPAFAADASQDPLDNWPHWRGPLANGSAPRADPPTKWDERTNIKWKVPVPGRGSSTPVVWGDRVFVLAAADTGRKADPADLPKSDPRFEIKTKPPQTYYQFLALCLDRATGKELWRRVAAEQVPHEGIHPSHSYAAASPVTDGRLLIAPFGSRGIYCYDLDGKLLWKRDLGLLHSRLGWGEGHTPALYGDTLVVNWDNEADSCVYALDARTGQTRWKKARDERTSWATPLVVPYKGRTQAILSATNKVRSYDLATGELIWECGGQTVNVIPSPVLYGDHVICVSGYRGAYACAIPLDSRGDVTGKVAWGHASGTPYVPSPLLLGDRLYFVKSNNGILTCLDARTGKPIIDQARLPGVQSVYASPAGAAGRVYVVSRDGKTLVLRDADRVEVLAENPLDDEIDASPVLVGRQLLLRGHGHLYCIEEK